MAEKQKKSFVFNVAWYEVLKDFEPEVRLEVYDAIIEYVASGKLSELKPLSKMAFSFIKKEIDYNNDRYQETVAKRSEAGKKGMSARYANRSNAQELTNVTSGNKTNTCYHGVTNLTNVTDNDNEYVDDNVNVSDKSSTPQSPPGGAEEEGETVYESQFYASPLSRRDGIPRNYDGLVVAMNQLGIPQRQQDEIARLSNFGQIGHPVWLHLKHCRESRDARLEKNRIKLPGNYVLKQLRAAAAPNPGPKPKPEKGPSDGD